MNFGKMTAAIVVLMSSSSALAGGLQWTVSESSGPVSVAHAGTTQIAQRGGALAIGDVIATGAKGRAVLVRGQEYLVVSPNSRISIADPAQSGGFIQIVQNWGSTIFKIEKKTEKHFAVKTPYLAAVVKGTTFNVTVDEAGARVQVTEGRVEVATQDGKAVSMVMPGEVGLVSAQDTLRLRVQGIEGRIIDSPQRNGKPAEAPAPAKVAGAASEETPAKVEEQQVAQADSTGPADQKPADAAAEATKAPAAVPVKPSEDASEASVRITSAIGEGAVKLETVTSGLVRGDSSLITTIKPVQVAFASVVNASQAAVASPVSAGVATEETSDETTPPATPPSSGDESSNPAPTQGATVNVAAAGPTTTPDSTPSASVAATPTVTVAAATPDSAPSASVAATPTVTVAVATPSSTPSASVVVASVSTGNTPNGNANGQNGTGNGQNGNGNGNASNSGNGNNNNNSSATTTTVAAATTTSSVATATTSNGNGNTNSNGNGNGKNASTTTATVAAASPTSTANTVSFKIGGTNVTIASAGGTSTVTATNPSGSNKTTTFTLPAVPVKAP